MNLNTLLLVGGGVAALAFKGKKDEDALVAAAAPIAAAKVATGVPLEQAAAEAASIVVGDKMLPAVGRKRREHPDAWLSNRMPLPYEKDVPLENKADRLVRRALPLTAELIKAGVSVSDAINQATDKVVTEDAFISPILPPPPRIYIDRPPPPPGLDPVEKPPVAEEVVLIPPKIYIDRPPPLVEKPPTAEDAAMIATRPQLW